MAAAAIRGSCRAVGSYADLVRIRDWWDFKLSPLLAIFYGAALARGAALLPMAPQALLLLLAVALCAAFVSAINHASDVRDDALAGKPNPMAGISAAVRAVAIALPAVAGMGIALLWRQDVPLLLGYLGSYVAFILYSLPPARLKGRGSLGVMADAAGAHLFPTLVALLTAWRAMLAPADPVLLAAAASWAFAFGLRGILWHQLGDIAADSHAAVRTLPLIFGPAAVRRFGERYVFPVEAAALALLLWRMGAALGVLALALHATALALRFWREGVAPAIVYPRPRAAIALHEFYGFWLPLAIIIQSGLHHPADLALVLVQVALFPGRAWQVAAEIGALARPPGKMRPR